MKYPYPRTRHVVGSALQHGDHDLKTVPFSELKGKNLVVEEKVDGANVGISFEGGRLMLQSRGHYLLGGPRERHFDLFKQWSATHSEGLSRALGESHVMYGEWMFAKHTCFYDELPHYFMEFDLLDKRSGAFLSTHERRRVYREAGIDHVIRSVRVIHEGSVKKHKDLESFLGRSAFKSPQLLETSLIEAATQAGVDPENAKAHTDMSLEMEGLYIKWEEAGAVKGRYKLVRPGFTNKIIDQETHWLDRSIIRNGLADGAHEAMFVT